MLCAVFGIIRLKWTTADSANTSSLRLPLRT
jgi:hypothetical protein